MINLLVFVVLYHHAVRKMVLLPTMLPVSVDQLNVLLLVRIVIHLLVFVVMYYHAAKKMVLQPTMLPVNAGQLNVLLLVRIATQMVIYAVILLLQCAVNKMVLQPTMLPVSVDQENVLLIQVSSVSNQTMVQHVVIKLLIQLHIHKLKVVHVVRYLEELIFRIKRRARLRQVI